MEKGVQESIAAPEVIPENIEKKPKAVSSPKKQKQVIWSAVKKYRQGNYRVQTASFQNKGEAYKRRDSLNNDGFHAYIERADLGTKGIWFRVYVGDYTKKDAYRIKKKLAEKYHIKPFVRKK